MLPTYTFAVTIFRFILSWGFHLFCPLLSSESMPSLPSPNFYTDDSILGGWHVTCSERPARPIRPRAPCAVAHRGRPRTLWSHHSNSPDLLMLFPNFSWLLTLGFSLFLELLLLLGMIFETGLLHSNFGNSLKTPPSIAFSLSAWIGWRAALMNESVLDRMRASAAEDPICQVSLASGALPTPVGEERVGSKARNSPS